MKSKTLFSLVVLTLFTSLIPAMHAQTFSVIHAFTGTGTEGEQPFLGVTIRGNALYGTANFVYQLTNTGSSWQYSTIALRRYGFGYTSRVVFGPARRGRFAAACPSIRIRARVDTTRHD
jgi:hypothetical protein